MKIPKPTTGLCIRSGVTGALMLLALATAHADYPAVVLSDTPLAYYPLGVGFDAASSGIATDLSGNNNNGTYSGTGPGFNDVPGPSPYITNGIHFSGGFTWVDLSNPALLNFAGPITMEAWVQLDAPASSLGNIVAKGYDGSASNNEITLRANGNGTDFYGGTYSDTNGVQGASGGQQTTNWTHLVSTHDGSTWRLYVNGTLVQSNPESVGALGWDAAWRIGNGTANGSDRYFVGNISHVAIYNHALSAARVLDHLTEGLVGLPSANARPIITAQPVSQSNYAGGNATFSVAAVSALTMTNQWFKNSNPINGQTNASLTLTNVQAGDVATYSVRVGNANGTTNSVAASFTLLIAGNNLRWLGTGNSGQWDAGSSPNWFNLNNSQQVVFNTGDSVLFTDVVDAPTNVVVASSVSPSLITVDATTNYFFTGTGPITGNGSFVKKGSGTLTMLSGANMTGPVAIGGGTVFAGNFAFTGASSITVTNNATLDFAGANITGNKPVFVSGTGVGNVGALINSSFETYNNVISITLLGDATIGGSSRWDFDNGSTLAGPYNMTFQRSSSGGYTEWKSLTIASNVGDIVLSVGKLGLKGPGNYGNPASKFIVQSGFELDFWDNANCNRTIQVLNNGKVQIFTAPASLNANVILEENAQWYLYGGSGTQPLNGNVTFNGVAHFLVGDAHRAYSGVLNGTGGFVVDGWNHQMVFSASNTYSGPTIIGDGPQVALTGSGSITHSSLIFFGGNNAGSVHLDATGRADQSLTLASGQTLGGIGQVAGMLTVGVGATLAPAGTNTTIGITTGQNTTGTISATGNIALNGTTAIKLNGNGVNDAVTSTTGSIALGGTLSLQNVSASPLAAGDSFQIFNAGSVTASFASITPATPGAGLAWNTNQLSAGIISVVSTSVSQPVINSTVISGGNLIFSGTNGTASGTYYVLTSTDVATPLSSWTPIATNTFGPGGGFSVTNAINLATPKRFYVIQLP